MKPEQTTLFGTNPTPLDESISSAAASRDRAKTSPSPERVKASKAPDRGFGPSSPGLWESFDPLGSSLRTSVLSALEGLTESSLTWRASATPAGRLWWVLGRSAPRTRGTGSGSWPTAQAQDSKQNGDRPCSAARMLVSEVRSACHTRWHWEHGHLDRAKNNWFGRSRDWPTVRSAAERYQGDEAARAYKAAGFTQPKTRAGQKRNRSGGTFDTTLTTAIAAAGQGGVLNSRWVAQLMGYPSGWLDVGTESLSRLWGTRSSRKSSRSSGKRLQKERS